MPTTSKVAGSVMSTVFQNECTIRSLSRIER